MEIKDNVLVKVTDNDINIDGTFEIPNIITKIGEDAFRNCRLLTKVYIPESEINEDISSLRSELLEKNNIPKGIKYVIDKAFNCYQMIESLYVPKGVTEIGSHAFMNCGLLKEINIPEGVTKLENSVFEECHSLKKVNIPSSITIIGENAFNGCNLLREINIPGGVIKIGSSAFRGCHLLEKVNIPEGVTKIEKNLFKGCNSLNEINIPSNVVEIGESAFESCIFLREADIPNSVIKIENGTFSGCFHLKKVNISDSTTYIGDSAFSWCENLKYINIPSGIKYIGGFAFRNCKTLWLITISENVIVIGDNAFLHCKNLNLNIKTSLFSVCTGMFDEFDNTFDVKILTIYDREVNLKNIKNSLRKIREEELYDRIKSELLDNKIKNKKCFKLSEHKEFIDKIINNLEKIENYDYRVDFDNYINDYINQHREISIEDIETILNEIKYYKIDNLDNVRDLTKYPFIISTIFNQVQSSYGKNIETIKLKKVLSKLTKLELKSSEDFIKVIEKMFFGDIEDLLVINKTTMNDLMNFSDNQISVLEEENNSLEMIKEIIRVYFEKTNECKINLNKNDEILLELEICEENLCSIYQQISNMIDFNFSCIMKVKEITVLIMPSLLINTSLNKVILKRKEEIDSLDNICKILNSLIELKENKSNEIECLESVDVSQEKVNSL